MKNGDEFMHFEKAGLSWYAIEPLIICLSHGFEVKKLSQCFIVYLS
jgi:hypothetical protein